MSVDIKPRSVLSDLKRPLMQPHSGISAELENKLLGTALPVVSEPKSVTPDPPAPQAQAMPRVDAPAALKKAKTPTVPVTFHLPIELRDKVKLTAQAKQTTMLEIAVEALNDYLGRNPVSEADVRRMLGL